MMEHLRMKKINLNNPTLLIFLLIISLPVLSKPEPLVIDKSIQPANRKNIRAAHKEINHTLSIDQVRFSILQATLSDKNGKWLMEEDGENYIIVRHDMAGEVLYARIEYNQQYVQLKYVDRESDFPCKKNVNGICYRNKPRGYYGKFERLRNLIVSSITNYGVKQ